METGYGWQVGKDPDVGVTGKCVIVCNSVHVTDGKSSRQARLTKGHTNGVRPSGMGILHLGEFKKSR